MSAIREFTSVTLTDNSNLVQINTNDSNFSVVPGSVIFIVGDRPRVVTSGDTVNRTLTLAIAYTGNDIVEKSATLIPLGQNDALLAAITSLTEAQNGLAEAYGNVSEVSWSVIIDPPVTATQWPDFTQVTGTLGESQLPEVAVKTPQLKALEDAEGRRGLRQSPANFNHDHNAHNHIHHDLLPKSLSELPPEYPPIKAPVLHFDSAQKKVHALFSSNDVSDSLEINGYKARRHFYVIDQPTYIQFNSLYTGKLSYRVFRWSTDTNAIPGLADATINQWSTVTVDVTDLDNFGTDGTGNYFYGIVDWICLEDKGVFVKLDKSFYVKDHAAGTYSAYIPSLGTIQKNAGPLDDPFVECFLRVDGRWESNDITPAVPFDIEPEWTQQSERVYICSDVEEPDDAVEFFPTYKTVYKSMTWAVVIRKLSGALTTAISNQGPHQSPSVGTKIYEGVGERICLKRAYGVLTTKVEVLFIKQLITDPDTYGN